MFGCVRISSLRTQPCVCVCVSIGCRQPTTNRQRFTLDSYIFGFSLISILWFSGIISLLHGILSVMAVCANPCDSYFKRQTPRSCVLVCVRVQARASITAIRGHPIIFLVAAPNRRSIGVLLIIPRLSLRFSHYLRPYLTVTGTIMRARACSRLAGLAPASIC